jgi:pimeloyl-ACP methyl ester carboxylesterase
MDDVRAVMQAAGSSKAVVWAISKGGPMGALFTASYPQWVERLVMYGSMARFSKSDDYPHQPRIERMLRAGVESWGTPLSAQIICTQPCRRCAIM